MDQETTTNLVAIESLFSVRLCRERNSQIAVCQINLSIDQRYSTVSKWLKECVLCWSVEMTP